MPAAFLEKKRFNFEARKSYVIESLVKQTQPGITWEETFQDRLSTLGCPGGWGGMSAGCCLQLIDEGRPNLLWAAPSPRQRVMNCIRVETLLSVLDYGCAMASFFKFLPLFIPHSNEV